MRGFFGDRCEAQVHSFMDDIQIGEGSLVAGHYQSYMTLGAEVFSPKYLRGHAPQNAQVGFICHAHDLEASTGHQGAATCRALFATNMVP